MTWRQRSAALVCVLALCIAPSQVRSQMAGPDDGASGRVFTMTPYAWAAGLKGDVATLSGLPAVEVDASFSDVLDSTDIALMLAGEMRQGKWGLLVDLVYLDLAPQADTRGSFSAAPSCKRQRCSQQSRALIECSKGALPQWTFSSARGHGFSIPNWNLIRVCFPAAPPPIRRPGSTPLSAVES
jgi:hypothetical protein